MSVLLSVLSLLALISCGPIQGKANKKKSKKQAEIVTLNLTQTQQNMARELGLKVEGKAVYIISGDQEAIDQLAIQDSITEDQIVIEMNQDGDLDARNFYLAKKDFNIPEFLAKNPTYDGRGVIVGGIDDGVSPSLPGLKTTTDGKRKFLNRTASSNFYEYTFKNVGNSDVYTDASAYTMTYGESFTKAFEAKIDIEKKKDTNDSTRDLNGNGSRDVFDMSVYETSNGVVACIDLDLNEKIDKVECLRPFSKSGDYIFWNKENQRELTFEYDSENNTIKLSEGEVSGDSHGEGVASVMSGHKIGGLYDGVAPGSQYIDYDLSQDVGEFTQKTIYSIGTFVRALEWMGQNGAEVVNISYSIFFYNAKSQDFMRKALKKLVEEYNMVISFSAGNNGPGLGSHNRGAIYPKDVLVAGAFLNKELDENVHGVTGLPEQGQVVYYSSIGPGVHGGMGATVISPLSSLTHNSGTDGYRAFNGTSSAAPALAGAAAVLISAVKQEGLKVDAGSIVHALRLSAKRLIDVPYVVQGAGLPKVDKALEIYKEIITGKQFKNIRIDISKSFEDGVKTQGLIYKTSEISGVEEEEVLLKGILSDIAPVEAAVNLVEPVRIEYSHDFIKGAGNLWIANSKSRLYIEIDLDAAKKLEHEVFGEIKIISQRTDKVLQTIPVTIINDIFMDKKVTVDGALAAQSGHRLHMKVPAGVKAVGVRMLDGTRMTEYARGNFYNSSRVRQSTLRGLAPGKVFYHEVDGGNSIQFTLARFGGTSNHLEFKYEIFPIAVSLNSEYVSVDNPKLNATNSYGQLNSEIIVREVFEPIAKVVKKYKKSEKEPFTISAEIDETGTYELAYDFAKKPMTTYFYFNCSYQVEKDDKVVDRGSGSSVNFILSNDLPKKLTFTCFPFDYDDKNTFDEMTIFGTITKEADQVMSDMVRLENGEIELNLKDAEMESGSKYEILMTPIFENNSSNEVSLGVVEAI